MRCFRGNYLKGDGATDDRLGAKKASSFRKLYCESNKREISARLKPLIFSLFSEYV